MYAVQTYTGVQGSNCKVPRRSIAKSPRHFAKQDLNMLNSLEIVSFAMTLQNALRQSAAKLCKAQCFQACKALQSRIAKSHPYGGRPGVRRLRASGLPPLWSWGRGRGRSKSLIDGGDGIPYRAISAGRL